MEDSEGGQGENESRDRFGSLFHSRACKADGRPKVLISETEFVTIPCNARPLARFSKDNTSAG